MSPIVPEQYDNEEPPEQEPIVAPVQEIPEEPLVEEPVVEQQAPATPEPSTALDAFFASDETPDDSAYRAATSDGWRKDAASQRNILKIADRSGVPVEAVEADPKGVNSENNAESFDADEFSRKNPTLAKFFEEKPNVFGAVHDDLDNVTTIANSIGAYKAYEAEFKKFVPGYLYEAARPITRGAMDLTAQMLVLGATRGYISPERAAVHATNLMRAEEILRATSPEMVAKYNEDMRGPIEETSVAMDRLQDAMSRDKNKSLLESLAKFDEANAGLFLAVTKQVIANAKNPSGFISENVRTLISSSPAQLSTMGGAKLGSRFGPVGTAAGAVAGSLLSQYQLEEGGAILEELSSRGVDVRDAKQLASALRDKKLIEDVLISSGKKAIGTAATSALLAPIFGGVASKIPSGYKRVIFSGAASGFEETSTEIAGLGLAGRDIRFGEALQEGLLGMGTEVGTTLTIANYLDRSKLPSSTATALQEVVKRNERAANTVAAISSVADAVESAKTSPVVAELPQVISDIAKTAGGDGTETKILFQRGSWDEHFNAQGKNPKDEADRITGQDPTAYAKGEAVGGDVAIPIGQFIANAKEFIEADKLIDGARLYPDGPTFAQSKEELRALPGTLKNLSEEAKAAKQVAEQPTETEILEGETKRILQGVGRGKEEAQAVGTAFSRMVDIKAKLFNTPVGNFFKNVMGIKFETGEIKITDVDFTVDDRATQVDAKPRAEIVSNSRAAQDTILARLEEQKKKTQVAEAGREEERAGRIKAEKELRTSKLTGLPNLIALEEDAKRLGWETAVFFDADFLKSYNTALGHDAVDKFLLKGMADSLMAEKGNSEKIIIYHRTGDEFAALVDGGADAGRAFSDAVEARCVGLRLVARGYHKERKRFVTFRVDGIHITGGVAKVGNEETGVLVYAEADAMERKHRKGTDLLDRRGVPRNITEITEGSEGDTKPTERRDVLDGKPKPEPRKLGQTLGTGYLGYTQIDEVNKWISVWISKNANKSTALHELMGHVGMEMNRKVLTYLKAANPASITADQALFMDDMDAVAKYLGADSIENLTDEQHEKFANTMVAYFKSGKAPNFSLARVFFQFGRWLRDIVTGHPEIVVPDDLRPILARHFATTETVDAVNADMSGSYIPGAIDEAMKNWPGGKEFAELAKNADLTIEQRLKEKLASEYAKEKTEQWQAEKNIVKAERRKEIDGNQRYQALKAVRDAGGLDIDKLKPESLKYLLDGVAVKGGKDPNVVAEQLGYTYMDNLMADIEGLVEPDVLAEMEAVQQMREEYGSPLATEDLEYQSAADEYDNETTAQRNRRRIKWMMEEAPKQFAKNVRALVRKFPVPARRVLEAEAEAIVGATEVSDLDPNYYKNALRESTALAHKLYSTVDLNGAIQELIKAERARAMYGAATKKRNEVQKAFKWQNRFNETKRREAIAKGGYDYIQQIDVIRDQFKLKEGGELKNAKGRAEWLVELAKDGKPVPFVADWMSFDDNERPWNSLTSDQFLDLTDTLKSMEHVALKNNKAMVGARKETLDELIQGAKKELWDNASKPGAEVLESRHADATRWKWFSKAVNDVTRLSYLARMFDGYKRGWFSKNILTPFNKAMSDRITMRDGANRALDAAHKAWNAKDADVRAEIPGAVDKRGRKVILSKMGTIMVALNSGNEDSVSKLVSNEGWTQETLDAINNSLNANDWAFVKSIWDIYDTYWPDVRALEMEVRGLPPGKIDGREIITKDHGTITGKYFPQKYDAERVSERVKSGESTAESPGAVKGPEVQTAEGQLARFNGQTTTRHGHRMARKADVVAKTRLDFGVVIESIADVTHDLAMYRAVRDSVQIFNGIRNDVRELYGKETEDKIKEMIDHIAVGEQEATNWYTGVIDRLSNGTTYAALAFNLFTSIQQPSGGVNAIPRLGGGWLGWKRLLGGYGQYMGGFFKGIVGDVLAESPEMRHRDTTMTQELSLISRKIRSKTPGWTWFHANMFTVIAKAQQLTVDIPVYLAAKQAAIETAIEAGREPDIQACIDEAYQTVVDTQGGGSEIDETSVQTKKTLKLFTRFISYPLSVWGAQREAYGQNKFKNPMDYLKFISDSTSIWAIPSLWSVALKIALGRSRDDWDDVPIATASDIASMGVAPFPLLNILGQSIARGKYTSPAGLRVLEDATRAGIIVKDNGLEAALNSEFWERSANVLGVWYGLPSLQATRTIKGTAALIEDPTLENILAPLVGPRSN